VGVREEEKGMKGGGGVEDRREGKEVWERKGATPLLRPDSLLHMHIDKVTHTLPATPTSCHTEEHTNCLRYKSPKSSHVRNFDPIQIALDLGYPTTSCNRLRAKSSKNMHLYAS
jgi:hypothetical protein